MPEMISEMFRGTRQAIEDSANSWLKSNPSANITAFTQTQMLSDSSKFIAIIWAKNGSADSGWHGVKLFTGSLSSVEKAFTSWLIAAKEQGIEKVAVNLTTSSVEYDLCMVATLYRKKS